MLSLAELGRTADGSSIVGDTKRRTNIEADGGRVLDCVSVSRSIEIAGRDWTKDTGPNGPVVGTAAVRALYLYPDEDRVGFVQASTLLFDWATGQVVSAGSRRSVPGGPQAEETGRVRCPDGSGPS